LWRFRNPHYRDTVLPLYVKPWSEISAGALRATSAPALGLRSGLGLLGALALGLGIAHAQGALSGASDYVKRTVADPVYAEQQLEFGLSLANAGQLERAREHLKLAVQHSPGSRAARSLLAEVEQHLQGTVAR
jgi:hypothetical protein